MSRSDDVEAAVATLLRGPAQGDWVGWRDEIETVIRALYVPGEFICSCGFQVATAEPVVDIFAKTFCPQCKGTMRRLTWARQAAALASIWEDDGR